MREREVATVDIDLKPIKSDNQYVLRRSRRRLKFKTRGEKSNVRLLEIGDSGRLAVNPCSRVPVEYAYYRTRCKKMNNFFFFFSKKNQFTAFGKPPVTCHGDDHDTKTDLPTRKVMSPERSTLHGRVIIITCRRRPQSYAYFFFSPPKIRSVFVSYYG